MSTEHDLLIGKQLGAYLVQSSLGVGGMARVYRAYHPRLRREVAVKVILAQIADREGFQARFEREAQVVASLEHPNIVSIYDFASQGHLTYLVMQYVGGGTLRDQLRGGRPLEPRRAIHYTIQMAHALHHAHQRGIVHRDVKPQNMLVSGADPHHLLLSDFGIAKIYQGGDDSAIADMPTSIDRDSSLTSVDQIIGTADYMSPEQARGHAVDARTDVYALGVVLYQMLTGEVPFRSTTLQGLLFQHVYTPPPAVRAKNPQVPDILEQIVATALAKAPTDRFQSAEAMARALDLVNANATNPLGELARSNPSTLATPVAPPPRAGQPTYPESASRSPYATSPESRFDSYATRPGAQTGARDLRATSLPGSGRTGRRPSPGFVLLALVLIACLGFAALRVLPGIGGGSPSGGSANPPAGSAAARAFHEQFQNNGLNWQTGSTDQGFSATLPGAGQYGVTVPRGRTGFPYPQNAGMLPENFTLSVSLQETAGGSTAFYGVMIHFGQQSSGTNGYGFFINNTGQCQIIKYRTATSTPPASAQCNYTTQGQTVHTLKVQAQGSNYTFFVDDRAMVFATSSNPANTTWSDGDLHAGLPALALSGPSQGAVELRATFVITQVQLTIP
ncbi:MAG TPA: protein kinase [Ktedonobacteraceae bacterium]|jgi:serine/threonine protein kinase